MSIGDDQQAQPQSVPVGNQISLLLLILPKP